MDDSIDNTNDLENYGVWVKHSAKDENDLTDSLDSLDLPDFPDTDTFDDTDFSDMFKDDSQFTSEKKIEDFDTQEIETPEIEIPTDISEQSLEASDFADFKDNFETNDNEISLDSFTAEQPTETEEVSFDSFEDVSFDSDGEEEISLDDFMDEGFSDVSVAAGNNGFEPGKNPAEMNNQGSEEVSLDDFFDADGFDFGMETAPKKEEEIFMEEKPLEMEISFDDSADSVETEDNTEVDTDVLDDMDDEYEMGVSLSEDLPEPVITDSSVNKAEFGDTEDIDLSDFGIDADAEETPVTQDVEEAKNKEKVIDYDLSVGNENMTSAPIVNEIKADSNNIADDEILDLEEEDDENMATVDSSLLQKIIDDLSGLRDEINQLKSNLAAIKSTDSAQFVENQEMNIDIPSEEENTGFFSSDDGDDTIALSGNELDNILNTAEFSETDGEAQSFENSPEEEIITDEPAFEEENVSDEINIEEEIISDEPTFEEEIASDKPTSENEIVSDEINIEEEIISDEINIEEEIASDEPTFEEEIVSDEINIEEEIASDEPTFEEEIISDEPTFENEIVSDEPTFEEDIITDEPTFEDDKTITEDSFDDSLNLSENDFEDFTEETEESDLPDEISIPKEEDDGIITVDDVISEPITDGFMAETAVDESEVFDDFNIEDTINTVDEDNSLSDESFDIFEEELKDDFGTIGTENEDDVTITEETEDNFDSVDSFGDVDDFGTSVSSESEEIEENIDFTSSEDEVTQDEVFEEEIIQEEITDSFDIAETFEEEPEIEENSEIKDEIVSEEIDDSFNIADSFITETDFGTEDIDDSFGITENFVSEPEVEEQNDEVVTQPIVPEEPFTFDETEIAENEEIIEDSINFEEQIVDTSDDFAENTETVPAEPEMNSELKRDIKSVLLYMDQLLENLPEDKIMEFAQSDEFATYKKLFNELGLS